MASPITTARNKYYENRKLNDMATPMWIGEYVAKATLRTLDWMVYERRTTVFDPAAGDGDLLRAFRKTYEKNYPNAGSSAGSRLRYRGIDPVERQNEMGITIERGDFFEQESQDWDDGVGLVVCNPPFNSSDADKDYWRGHPVRKQYQSTLIPDLFARRVWDRFGPRTRLVLFTPAGFVTNQRLQSRRYGYYNSVGFPRITGVVMLPLDSFPGVEFPMLVLMWNMDVEPFLWLGQELD